MYGLKQPPRPWAEKLKSFLLHVLLFTVFVANCCLFIKSYKDLFVLLLVYVGDIVITSTSTLLIGIIITSINAKFKLKDLGSLNYVFRLEVTRSDDYMLLNQTKYIQDLIFKVGLSDTSSFQIPMIGTCLTQIGMDMCIELFVDGPL